MDDRPGAKKEFSEEGPKKPRKRAKKNRRYAYNRAYWVLEGGSLQPGGPMDEQSHDPAQVRPGTRRPAIRKEVRKEIKWFDVEPGHPCHTWDDREWEYLKEQALKEAESKKQEAMRSAKPQAASKQDKLNMVNGVRKY